MNIKQFEKNVIQSFELVKRDITNLHNYATYLKNELEQVKNENSFLNKEIQKLSETKRQTIVRTSKQVANKTIKRKFVATRNGKKFHDSTCPFAKNIKPKNKVILKSKEVALNNGYKPCNCLN